MKTYKNFNESNNTDVILASVVGDIRAKFGRNFKIDSPDKEQEILSWFDNMNTFNSEWILKDDNWDQVVEWINM